MCWLLITLQFQLQFFPADYKNYITVTVAAFIHQESELQWLRPGWYSTVEQISGCSDRERHGGLRHAGKGLHQGA